MARKFKLIYKHKNTNHQNGWYLLCSDRFALEHFVLTVLSRHNLHWCQTCIDHHFVLAYHVLANFDLWHILFWNYFCIGLLCPGQVCTVAHFVLKLILHQLIMSWTILYSGKPAQPILPNIKANANLASVQNCPMHNRPVQSWP